MLWIITVLIVVSSLFALLPNHRVIMVLKHGIWRWYKERYLQGTGAWNVLFPWWRVDAVAYNQSLHNMYANMIEAFGMFELIVFWFVFLKYFNFGFSILLLFYGLTMSSPFYFFVAFCLVFEKRGLYSPKQSSEIDKIKKDTFLPSRPAGT